MTELEAKVFDELFKTMDLKKRLHYHVWVESRAS